MTTAITYKYSEVWQQLTNLTAKQRLPHAILFIGEAGEDKTDFVVHFANYLLCQAPNNQPCGKCRSCQQLAVQSHPDFYYIDPEGKSLTIKIDAIRQLITHLNQTATNNSYKLAIINCADSMNVAASNALLKTLEEPSPNVLLMLITDRYASLLPTIRSRCQIIRFRNHDDSDLNDRRLQQLNASIGDDNLVIDSLSALQSGQASAVDFAKNLADHELINILDLIDLLLLDNIKARLAPTTSQQSSLTNKTSANIGKTITPTNIIKLHDQIYNMKRSLRNNCNKQLLLEELGMIIKGYLNAN